MLKRFISKWPISARNLFKQNDIKLPISYKKLNFTPSISLPIKRITHFQSYSFQTSDLDVIKTNDIFLSQLAKIKGQNSIQYANNLFDLAMKYSMQCIQNESSNPIIKKAQQYFLKILQVLQRSPHLKEQINQPSYLAQLCLARFYFSLNRLDQSKDWYNQFLKKIQKLNNQKREQSNKINQFQFFAYGQLSILNLSKKQFDQAKKNYQIYINLMKTRSIEIPVQQKLMPIRDYAFMILHQDREQGFKAMNDLINLSNLKNQDEATIIFQAHTFYVSMGEPKMALELLQRIVKQTEQIQQNNSNNPVYIGSLQYLTNLCHQNKQYPLQYQTIKKTIQTISSGSNIQGRQYRLLHLLVQKSQTQANLGLLSQSYLTLYEASKKIYSLDQLPVNYQPFDLKLKSAKSSFQSMKLQQKYLDLLDHIIKQIERLRTTSANNIKN